MSVARAIRVLGRGGILHNHSFLTVYPDSNMLQPLLRLTGFLKVRWVESIHDRSLIERFPAFSPDERALFYEVMTEAATIIAIGDDLRDFLVGIGIASDKIVVGQPLLPTSEDRPYVPQELAGFFSTHSPMWI